MFVSHHLDGYDAHVALEKPLSFQIITLRHMDYELCDTWLAFKSLHLMASPEGPYHVSAYGWTNRIIAVLINAIVF